MLLLGAGAPLNASSRAAPTDSGTGTCARLRPPATGPCFSDNVPAAKVLAGVFTVSATVNTTVETIKTASCDARRRL